MTSSGTWTGTNFWSNGDVWDTDFYDHELTGGQYDQGDTWFDVPGGAIAWAIGHGNCTDDLTTITCTSDANCLAVGGYCPKFGPVPSGASKVCIKKTPRAWRIPSNCAENLLKCRVLSNNAIKRCH
jgi:hypothetical protein